MDAFHSGGRSFVEWASSYNLESLPSEEKERFLNGLVSLQRNSALQFLLNRLEASALVALGNALPGDDKRVLEGHLDLMAVRRFRALITAAVQDQRLTALKPKT